MSESKKRRPLAERLKTGMEEILLFAQGKLALKTTDLPKLAPKLRASEVQKIRKHCRMSQYAFAGVLNVSVKTVQSWEQGARLPSQATLRLLQVMEKSPETVCKAAGVSIGQYLSANGNGAITK